MPFKKGGPAGPGRPKGKPNKATADIKALAQKHGERAIRTLVRLMTKAKVEATRIAAARELLDRGYGKAAQLVEAEINQTIRYEVELAFGRPATLQGQDALPARVQGPSGDLQSLVHRGSA